MNASPRNTTTWMLPLMFSLAVLMFLSGPADAASLVGTQSGNGATLEVFAGAGFDGTGSVVGLDLFPVDAMALALPILGPTATAAPTPLSVAPASSSKPGDVAELTASLEFAFGTPFGGLANDTVTFSASGTVSAFDAHNSAGNPADAVAGALGTLNFFVDPFLVPPGATAGTLLFPDLRPLDPLAGETLFQITVLESGPATSFVPTTIATLAAGDPGISLSVVAGNGYEIRFEYEAKAPFGTDPSFALDYQVTLVAVPEPQTHILMGIGFLLVAFGFRRR